jgi:P27 family predicted phage terminase small subunit
LHPARIEDDQQPPACPDGLGIEASAAWDAIWRSPLRAVIAHTDLPALERWAWWYDQWLRASSFIERHGPVTRGKRGDEVMNTRVRYLRACEDALGKLEEAFGMNPLARMRLGISAVEGRSAVERLKAAAVPDLKSRRLDAPEEDPREYMRKLTSEPGGGG